MRISLGMTLVNLIIFLVLAIYFDQVIPNEFGKKRHWLLCLHREKKKVMNADGGIEYEDEEPDSES